MSKNFSVVLTTYSKDKTGSKIIGALLAARLAACVQVIPMLSFYTWKGKLSTGREHLMLIKAKTRDFKAIEKVILLNHDYELPEIVSVRIDQGLAGYLRWMDKATR